ncbi:hypothetical protein PC116_g3489 [Phytophthora cactorum]|uniref:Uncharacterized protein n=1 Tax=Phytophthora cactorum TaxID=29920 RepID=A0A8T1LGZ2_9STRA|nr:hypothetical protein Pcac1_g15493 [Phytophthora cactorum]KAG2905160.1 hypothetical protein PC114_g11641 [Phytophthora cactorum]KAG2914029.1 hypothetical protein PC117_g18447 [Phytophthora cactorum]KAG3010660.1 hypothetical protein PC120_g14934 [Phytophthora cactorum]KAG3016923.1 hypothetical protein PC119_g11207 [Phytophthora cactorum]
MNTSYCEEKAVPPAIEKRAEKFPEKMPMENDYEYFVRDCYTG